MVMIKRYIRVTLFITKGYYDNIKKIRGYYKFKKKDNKNIYVIKDLN